MVAPKSRSGIYKSAVETERSKSICPEGLGLCFILCPKNVARVASEYLKKLWDAKSQCVFKALFSPKTPGDLNNPGIVL